jgi:hypothetical protein
MFSQQNHNIFLQHNHALSIPVKVNVNDYRPNINTNSNYLPLTNNITKDTNAMNQRSNTLFSKEKSN